MTAITGATPLIALDAVAIDTETTGLDTATDRIVQIGAIAIAKGRVRSDQSFELLVDPETAIPSRSAQIHGITNAVVRNAPAFREVWPKLQRFRRGRVVIGYAIGFDLAVLENEVKRAGGSWERPTSLCVRLLALVANPALPDQSLEAIADWLGVAISGRHQALGDAKAAADIFVALLPKLQARGIRTLAQAERASLQMKQDIEQGRRAGWADPVVAPEAVRPMGSLDPYAYRNRVRDVMTANPLVAAEEMAAGEAIRLMVEKRISSLFVSATAGANRPVGDYGIVTERDIMRVFARRGAEALATRLGEIASRPLVSVRAEAFVYRAVGRMDRLKIRHLAVRDEEGRLVGVVSSRDLLRLRASAAIRLDDTLEAARTPAEMAAAWATLPSVADRLIAEGVEARTVCEIVSEELRAVTRRAAVLAEAQMEKEGLGRPPCPYALMVLGSGGRGESLLAGDQDNAIVFQRGEPDGPEDRWFAKLGAIVADFLDTAGVPYCKGGVMARNPAWRGSLDLWQARLEEWVRRSRPEDLLNVDIVFDQRPVHGDHDLAHRLFDHAYAAAQGEVGFAKLLGEQAAGIGSPFALFGGLQTDEAGRLDLKLHGLFPIVSMARALAIRHDIRARSTRERLEGLIARDIGGEADLTRILSAHALILSLMLSQQSRDLHAGLPATNKVEVARLDKAQAAALKSVLRDIQVIPDLLRNLMFG